MKQRVASGLLRGCPDCDRGLVLLDIPGRVSLVPCLRCDGKGYLVVWRCLDLTKLKGRVAA